MPTKVRTRSRRARRSLADSRKPGDAQRNHLIAVVGGSGAGKSWLVDRLLRLFGSRACRVQLDDFYRDLSHVPATRRATINFDAPRAIDWKRANQVLHACSRGRSTRMPHYDFVTFGVTENKNWKLKPVVIVDGLWPLYRKDVRALFELKLYLDVPTRVRCSRRLRRDIIERGFTPAGVRQQLNERVLPQHQRYVAPQKKWADLVLTQPYRAEEVEVLADRLWALGKTHQKAPQRAPARFRARVIKLIVAPR